MHEKEMDHFSTVHTHNDPTAMPSILLENQDNINICASNKENVIVSTTNASSILLPSVASGEWISPPSTTIHRKRAKRYNLCNDHWNRILKLIPNYNELSPYQFKDVLIRIISLRDRQNTEQWLVNFTLLKFIQQRAQLLCDVFQLKIEDDYWKYMNNLTNMPVVIWLLEISKDIIRQNSINWDHTKTKANIERRREMIHSKLQRAENHLHMHLQQPYPLSCQMDTKTAMDHSMNIIINALIILVQNSLSPFRTNFKQKKILLEFDIHDMHLVKSFYALNPTMEQISTIQKIWRAKLKLCQKTIRQKKKNQSSSIIYHMTTENINLNQSNVSPLTQSLSPSMSNIIKARLENIEERTQRLLNFNNTISDNTFF
ncbi:unnamed protein product [Adineta steineri]|nr:unnamed protein product [Adineta steineri]